jgi:predicted Zn-dependent protease
MNQPTIVWLIALGLGVCVAPSGQAQDDTQSSASPLFSLPKFPVFSGSADSKPIIAGLKSGRYEPSSLAVGEQKDLARQRGEQFGFVSSSALEVYLGQIRAKLLGVSGVTDVPGKVVIVASSAFAAFATPDGNAYVAMAWLNDLESEDEMAAIIAHELSHVLLKHHSSDIVTGIQKRARAMYELGVGAKMQLEKTAVVAKNDQRALTNAQNIIEVFDKLVMPAWNRTQEREADLLGIDLLVRAGYSPIGMTTMLERYQAWEIKNKEQDDAFWQRVNETAKQNASKAAGMALGRLMEGLSTSHPETSKRLEDIATYIDKHYGNVKIPDPKTRPWEEVKSRSDVVELVRNYKSAFTARDLLFNQRKASDAYSKAKDSATGPTATHAYPNWIFAKSAMATGRGDEALAALDGAIKSNEPVRQVYDEMISVNEQRGAFEAALGWTDKASATFGEADSWVPTKIRLLRRAGRTEEASALTLKCTVETPEWRQSCQQANQTLTPSGRPGGSIPALATPSTAPVLAQPPSTTGQPMAAPRQPSVDRAGQDAEKALRRLFGGR